MNNTMIDFHNRLDNIKKRVQDNFIDIKWLLLFIRPYKFGWITGNITLALSAALLQILISIGLEQGMNSMYTKNIDELYMGVKYLLLTLILYIIADFIYCNTYKTAMSGIKASIKGAVFHKFLRRKISYSKDKHSGDYMTSLEQDCNVAVNILGRDMNYIISGFALLIILLITLIVRNPRVGIINLILLIISIGPQFPMMKKLEELGKRKQLTLSKVNQSYLDTLSGAMLIKQSNLYQFTKNRIRSNSVDLLDCKTNIREESRRHRAWTGFFEIVVLLFTLLYGAYMCFSKQIQIGELVFLVQLSSSLSSYSNRMYEGLISLTTSQESVKRIKKIMDEEDEVSVFGVDEPNDSCETVLNIKDLCYAYEKDEVLRGVSFEVKRNEMIAIVGASGSGKSTLFRCLLQLLDYEGSMKIYGVDSKSLSLTSLRSLYSYVEQEAKLFDGTLYENIGYGNEFATFEEIKEAASKAYAHDFIVDLPNGYDTIIGENGYKLSGGERQRVAIARAILKNAPILLLDEATSSLDSRSEGIVQKAIESLMIGKTVLVIAHRLSTIENANTILLMEDGRVVEQGRNQELLDSKGKYYKLYYSRGNGIENCSM